MATPSKSLHRTYNKHADAETSAFELHLIQPEQMMMKFDQSICSDLNAASSREWLETNGLGGFASSTISGLNTRRYHGLLVAATKPPVGRSVLLSKLEETVIIDGERFDLSTNQYPGAIHPRGFEFQQEFRLDPYPLFTYKIKNLTIEKRLFMVHGENTTVVQYKLSGRGRATLQVRPLIAFRDYHSTTHENPSLRRELQLGEGLVSISPYDGAPTLHLAHNAVSVDQSGDWYRNFQYQREQERGLDFEEDLYNPCALTFELTSKTSATVIASTEIRNAADAKRLEKKELARRQAIINASPVENGLVRSLSLAADQYLVARGEHQTIIAGYHWFADWGRDTMISLPGLTLVTGRFAAAKDILREFSRHFSDGMLPNHFPDSGEAPEYNTVDATLWYFEAVRAYLEYTNDEAFVRELYPILLDSIDWHVRGTRYGIYVEEGNGLLHAGVPGVQLTWMDAKVGDWVVTPRIGKPVEVQALWYNALRTMEAFADRFGFITDKKRFSRMAVLAQWSFNRTFWNEAAGCLYDVTNGGPPDGSIRPNQLFAISLHHSMLPLDRAKQVLEVVERELLTPAGLRTLPASDSRYCPIYTGNQYSRDGAYHQGTVWPWLLGPFITAYTKVNGKNPATLAKTSAILNALESQLQTAGLGHVSEIHDANAPHASRGCVAQAWSVAEILRAAVQDVFTSADLRKKIDSTPGRPVLVKRASR